MYLSLDWLKDFVEIPKNISPDELGSRLTIHTVEIDGVEKQADKFANVLVGKILEVKKHPNAERLQLARVSIGKEELGIVCGAPNIEAGQLVPVACVGAVLPNGMEIREALVRGEKSVGMLCAEDELGLGADHAGILILEKHAKVGQKFSEYLGLKDTIFEVDNKSITNRADLWGHFGMAREIAAFLNTKTTKKFDKILESKIEVDKEEITINAKVLDKEMCPRYMALAMDGIKIGPSPEWMQRRLTAAAVRPINNIVDITNYVMMELGQPMHAFDATMIDKIIVRRAKKNEVIKTLDGEKRELNENMLVIANAQDAVAVAGVMGGEYSEVKDETTRIVFESANFEHVSLRKTSTALGLRTESSIRYEKGLDPNLCAMALARAVELVREICPGAKVISKVVDEKNFSLNQGPIDLSVKWLNNFVGADLKKKKVIDILESLGFGVEGKNDDLKIAIPSWRAVKDISIREDLAEEVSRIIGYDNLETVMPMVDMKRPLPNKERLLERKIKNILASGAHLAEVYNYSFVGEEQLDKLGVNHTSHIRLANPISIQHTLLRQNLATNLISNIRTNQARFDEIGLFEIGSVYLSIDGGLEKGDGSKDLLPYQEKRLGILVANNNREVFSDAKGVVQYLFDELKINGSFSPIDMVPDWADKAESAKIIIDRRLIGTIYKINKTAATRLGIKKESVIVEMSLKELFAIQSTMPVKKYQEFEKFPPLVRDLAFVVNEKMLYADIMELISAHHEYLKNVEVFDVYQGDKLGAGKKSLAFHLSYQAGKTLTAEEVDAIQKDLIKKLEDKFEAKVRDF